MADIFTLILVFYDISVSCKALIILNFDSTFDLTDVPASIYDLKTATRHFDTIHDIPRSLSPAQIDYLFSKAEIRQLGVAETEGLKL